MRPYRLVLLLTSAGLAVSTLAGPVPASGERAAGSAIDDRQLARSKGWQPVKQKQAYRKTLTRGTKRKATLTTKTAATAGGSVTFQVGPRRGSVTIAVGDAKPKQVSTSAKRVGFRSVAFSGTGRVRIAIAKPGKGVYVDKVVLDGGSGPGGGGPGGPGGGPAGPTATPAYATGALTQVDASVTGAGANGTDVNSAAVSPDGTRAAFWSTATNLVPGVADGLLHLYVKDLASGAISAVDRSQSGVLGNDGGYTSEGRVVGWLPGTNELLFTTYANNLLDGSILDTSYAPFLMAKDLSDNSVGFIAAGSYDAAWSPNGQWLAFTSRYINGCGDGPCAPTSTFSTQVFAWLRNSTTYVPVSADSSGALPVYSGGPIDADDPVWSPDSTRVAFTSYASTLVPGDTNSSRDVFVKTISNGATSRVSTGPGGAQGNGYSQKAAWSPDGTRIAFASAATNLVVGDNNSYQDVFVKDLGSGAVSAVSVRQDGRFPLGVNGSDAPSWSPDGSKILFSSHAIDLLDGAVDKNTFNDIYVKYLATGAVRLVSVLPDGTNASSSSTRYGLDGTNSAAWAPDGRSVFFLSRGTNLAVQDNNAFEQDLFRKFLD
jgi:Tol biopolymer transport system component